jgi:predicted CopG family antitoxin
MSKTISVDETAYDILSSLKQGKRDSFSQVIRRIAPARNAGELMDFYDQHPAPEVNLVPTCTIKR